MPLQRRIKKKKGRAGTGIVYSATDIRELFFAETSSRQAANVSGDGGYWKGGRCQWGGSHNLDEDAQTLAKFLNKIAELDNAKVELMDCSDRQEFALTKQKLITQCDEAISGLRTKTSSNSSIGGICIIWSDFTEFLENTILKRFRQEFSRLKSEITDREFEEAKELAVLDIEQEKIEQEMIDNARKAEEAKDDPAQQAIFLELIEQNKQKLREIDNKKKQNKLYNLGFDINSHIDELLRIAKSGTKVNQFTINLPHPEPNQQPSQNPNQSPISPKLITPPRETPLNKDNDNSDNFFIENKHLIFFCIITSLIFFYFNSQNDEELPLRKQKGSFYEKQ